MLVGGARNLVMGVNTKGEGHYLWTSGTQGVLSQVKKMVFGPHAGVGGVARVHFGLTVAPQITVTHRGSENNSDSLAVQKLQ